MKNPIVDGFEVGNTCLFWRYGQTSRKGIIVEAYRGSQFTVNNPPRVCPSLTVRDSMYFGEMSKYKRSTRFGDYCVIFEDMFNHNEMVDSMTSYHFYISKFGATENLWELRGSLSEINYRVTKIGSVYEWGLESLLTYPHRKVVELGTFLIDGLVFDPAFNHLAQEYRNAQGL